MARNYSKTTAFSVMLFFMIILLHSLIRTASSLKFNHSLVTVSPLRRPSSSPSSMDTIVEPISIYDHTTKDFFFTRLGVGRPSTNFDFVIDTTTDLIWLRCDCDNCFEEYGSQEYDPTQSSSYHELPCSSPHCSAFHVCGKDYAGDCGDDPCEFQTNSPGGDPTSGELATETFDFGYVKNLVFGCGHFSGGSLGGASGVLGLSKGHLSFPHQLGTESFGYCVNNRGSRWKSYLYFNTPQLEDSIVVPMLRSHRFKTLYYVDLIGISVGGEWLDIPESIFQISKNGAGGVVIDSGSPSTLLPREAFLKLRQAFVDKTPGLEPMQGAGDGLHNTCFQLPSSSPSLDDVPDGIFPAVALHFGGGKTLSLGPKNCFVSGYPSGVVCLSVAPSNGRYSVIGNRMQIGTLVSFDLANEQIGFTPNACEA